MSQSLYHFGSFVIYITSAACFFVAFADSLYEGQKELAKAFSSAKNGGCGCSTRPAIIILDQDWRGTTEEDSNEEDETREIDGESKPDRERA